MNDTIFKDLEFVIEKLLCLTNKANISANLTLTKTRLLKTNQISLKSNRTAAKTSNISVFRVIAYSTDLSANNAPMILIVSTEKG